jgi:restriction endonuclease Mrr
MIPDFQSIMLPFLNIISDGQEHSTNEINDQLANYFNLTPAPADLQSVVWSVEQEIKSKCKNECESIKRNKETPAPADL